MKKFVKPRTPWRKNAGRIRSCYLHLIEMSEENNKIFHRFIHFHSFIHILSTKMVAFNHHRLRLLKIAWQRNRYIFFFYFISVWLLLLFWLFLWWKSTVNNIEWIVIVVYARYRLKIHTLENVSKRTIETNNPWKGRRRANENKS